MTVYLDASRTVPELIAPGHPLELEDETAVVLWSDDAVVIHGLPGDVRALFARALALIPTDSDNLEES